MAIYKGEKQGRPGRGVLEVVPKGVMAFDSITELCKYLREHGKKMTRDKLRTRIGDGKKHDGVRYEYERK